MNARFLAQSFENNIVTEDPSIIGNNSSTDDLITDVLGGVETVDETFLEENAIELSQPNHLSPFQTSIQTESIDISPMENVEKFECLTCHKVGNKILIRLHTPSNIETR